MSRDRRLGRRGGASRALSLLQQAEQEIAASAFSWPRPDSLSGSNLRDRVNASHILTKAGSGTITSNAAFNNRPVVNFDAATTFTSNYAASAWDFLINGAGCTVFFAYAANAVTQYPFILGAAGLPTFLIYSLNTGNGGVSVYDDDSAHINVDTAALFRPSPGYIEVSYSEGDSPKYTVRKNGVLVGSGDATTPTATDPAGTLILGGRETVYASGEWADCIVFQGTIDAGMRSTVESYMNLRYGL